MKANTSYLVYCVLRTISHTLTLETHLILTTTLEMDCYYSCFKDEDIVAQ